MRSLLDFSKGALALGLADDEASDFFTLLVLLLLLLLLRWGLRSLLSVGGLGCRLVRFPDVRVASRACRHFLGVFLLAHGSVGPAVI